jgi:hypothetical protein
MQLREHEGDTVVSCAFPAAPQLLKRVLCADHAVVVGEGVAMRATGFVGAATHPQTQ